MNRPEVVSFFDPETSTGTHVLIDPDSPHCAIIDPVLDYDPKSGSTDTSSVDPVIAFVRARGLEVDWILETHVHADHLSAAPRLREALGGREGIGEHVRDVQAIFKELFNAEADFATDGSQFDALFADGDGLRVGSLEGRVLHTPGHTPACVTYLFGDAAFIGDTLFSPDYGTARCDFPGGDATALYRSIRRILELPPETRLFLCHDYPPTDRPIQLETSVAAQRADNVHVHDGVDEAAFVAMRTRRDATLEMPVLILPSVQVNMRAGQLPPAEANGRRYLKIPLNAFERHGGAVREHPPAVSSPAAADVQVGSAGR
ncbi:MAG TPA: MBL fold metallo-hydrolase [Pseudomonadales bacterium]|nr:MBL fold metallo-hydrolase [Pseudomonadales bacterium]